MALQSWLVTSCQIALKKEKDVHIYERRQTCFKFYAFFLEVNRGKVWSPHSQNGICDHLLVLKLQQFYLKFKNCTLNI